MKMKPLAAGGLFGARRDAGAAPEGRKPTREEKRQQKQRAKEEQIDAAILDTDVKLRLLKDRYRLLLEKELRIARANKGKGKKNSANYSRIGVAYYSLHVVNAAQERLQELSSSRELYRCMNGMSAALATINGLNGRIGRLDPRKIVKGMKQMTAAGNGASGDLLKTLSVLSGLETASEDRVSLDALVSADVIEKLINGEDVDSCVDGGEGLLTQADELLDLFGELPEFGGGLQEAGEPPAQEDIEAATRNIASLLDQL